MTGHILALGGSKHFQMLPYTGDPYQLVAKPTSIKYESELPPIPVMANAMEVERYRVEKLGVRDNDSGWYKLVYVHEDLTNKEAIEELKNGLLQMFVKQPYKDSEESNN